MALVSVGVGRVDMAKETNLSTEVVGQTSIRIEDGQVGTADLADSQLLVTGRTRRVGEGLELALCVMMKFEVSVSMETER